MNDGAAFCMGLFVGVVLSFLIGLVAYLERIDTLEQNFNKQVHERKLGEYRLDPATGHKKFHWYMDDK